MFLKTVVWADKSLAASTSYQEDLPSLPMSHLLFTLKFLNVTNEGTLAELVERITDISVKDKGVSIFQMNGADLWAFNCIHLCRPPIMINRVATDNATRAITFIIPFGRKLYNPAECYPERPAGDVKFYLTTSATETAVDGLIAQLECVSLVGASPANYLKVYTKTYTPAATGLNSVDLERGNLIAGLMLFSTTVPTGTAWTTSLDEATLLGDNQELVVSDTYWETLHGSLLERVGYIGDFTAAFGDDLVHKYALIDFMQGVADENLLPTDALKSFKLRFVAGDTNLIRIIPLEVVAVG